MSPDYEQYFPCATVLPSFTNISFTATAMILQCILFSILMASRPSDISFWNRSPFLTFILRTHALHACRNCAIYYSGGSFSAGRMDTPPVDTIFTLNKSPSTSLWFGGKGAVAFPLFGFGASSVSSFVSPRRNFGLSQDTGHRWDIFRFLTIPRACSFLGTPVVLVVINQLDACIGFSSPRTLTQSLYWPGRRAPIKTFEHHPLLLLERPCIVTINTLSTACGSHYLARRVTRGADSPILRALGISQGLPHIYPGHSAL